MAFWNDSSINILPKFRFSLNFGGVIWWVKTAQFPKLSQEKADAKTGFGGHSIYKPGPATWQPITITMADVMLSQSDFSPYLKRDMSTQMFWFGIANVLDDHQQGDGLLISKSAGVYDEGFTKDFYDRAFLTDRSKLSEIEIEKHYDKEYDANEKWILQNILVSEIDFGGGDYSSDDINEISVTLTYDIARPETTDVASPFFSTTGNVTTKREEIKKRKKDSSSVIDGTKPPETW